MLTAAEFTQLLNATGVTVSHRQAKPPHTVTQVKVVPGSVDKRSETLVNAYGVNGRTIELLASALPTPPEKMDQITFGGEKYTVSDVVPMHERGTGSIISYLMFMKGR